MKIKCCRTCKECSLDIQAIMRCSVVIDKCALKDELVLHPWFSGWRCKFWRAKHGN
jgi:hypothetical protein